MKRSAQERRGFVVLKRVFAGFVGFEQHNFKPFLHEKSPFYCYGEYVSIAIILELRSVALYFQR